MKNLSKKSSKTVRKQVNILDIMVDSTSLSSVLTAVEEKVSHSQKFYITTPNPELVLASTKNLELKKALNNADFSIPDGIGLAQAAKFLSFKRNDPISTFFQGVFVGLATLFNKKYLTSHLEVIRGRELFLELVKLAQKNKWKVFFLGGLDNEAKLAAEKLRINNLKLKIETAGGPQVTTKLSFDILKRINSFNPDLLFVAFGNPKQEIWIHKNISKLNIGGAMAVGGTFRYLSGLSKLPPKWMENIGIEWVWRLFTEPFRFRRIFNAFPTFPLRVWFYKMGIDK